MNYETIEKYLKECFLSDGIKKEDLYTKSYVVTDFHNEKLMEYNVKEKFKDYIYGLCENFYDFCCENNITENEETIEEIKKEILSSDTPVSYGDDYDDLENIDFIYHWYITDRLGSCFHDDFDFFVNIINDIQT